MNKLKQLPDAYREFERLCKHRGFRVCERGETPWGEFFIGETDKEIDTLQFPDYPEGYYQVVWAFAGTVSQGKLDVARWLEFSALHDLELKDDQRRMARINAAKADCEYFIKKNLEASRIH